MQLVPPHCIWVDHNWKRVERRWQWEQTYAGFFSSHSPCLEKGWKGSESSPELENSAVAEEWVQSIAENKTDSWKQNSKAKKKAEFRTFVHNLGSLSLQALSNQLLISVSNTINRFLRKYLSLSHRNQNAESGSFLPARSLFRPLQCGSKNQGHMVSSSLVSAVDLCFLSTLGWYPSDAALLWFPKATLCRLPHSLLPNVERHQIFLLTLRKKSDLPNLLLPTPTRFQCIPDFQPKGFKAYSLTPIPEQRLKQCPGYFSLLLMASASFKAHSILCSFSMFLWILHMPQHLAKTTVMLRPSLPNKTWRGGFFGCQTRRNKLGAMALPPVTCPGACLISLLFHS